MEELAAGRSERCSLPSARGPAPPCPPGAESCSGCHGAVFSWLGPGPWEHAVPDVLQPAWGHTGSGVPGLPTPEPVLAACRAGRVCCWHMGAAPGGGSGGMQEV